MHILPILTLFNSEIINEFEIKNSSNSLSNHEIQLYLANYMTSLIHGNELSNHAARLSAALFSPGGNIDLSGIDFSRLLDSSRLKSISISKLATGHVGIFDFLKQVFIDHSNNQIRSMIRSGGIRLNHKKIDDPSFLMRVDEFGDYIVLNYGKTSFFIVKIEN